MLCVELLQGTSALPYIDSQFDCQDFSDENHAGEGPGGAVAMDCEMVGGGSDGSLELCARVCLVDEDERLIFHTYVQPEIPVTNYRYFFALFLFYVYPSYFYTLSFTSNPHKALLSKRKVDKEKRVLGLILFVIFRYDITGLTEEHLRNAMPLKEVREKLLQILHNGESIGKVRLDGGKARLLVGHDLAHDLDCLKMNYPDHMLR